MSGLTILRVSGTFASIGGDKAMIHYNAWFALRDNVAEDAGLAAFEEFLQELNLLGEVEGFRLHKNASEGSRTKMLRFHAIIEFRDEAALSRAMKRPYRSPVSSTASPIRSHFPASAGGMEVFTAKR